MVRKQLFSQIKTLVVKVGTSVLADAEGAISRANMNRLVDGIAFLRRKGINVVLVSSGAIAYGMEVLNLDKRPKQLPTLQACAAIGQGKLMKIYEELFARHEYNTAQLLLTRDGLDDRVRYINARNTLLELITLGVVPIINENDTVSTDEIKFGDNDELASQVATLINADCLILLSDIDGLYKKDTNKKIIFDHIETIDDSVRSHLFSKTNERTKGGMESKLNAADRVMRAGISMIIANGHQEGILKDLYEGKTAGTLFFSGNTKQASFKNWLSFSADLKGHITVDDGAYAAVVEKGKSLLAAGIVGVTGTFDAGAIVAVCRENGKEFARGIVNFSADELRKIKGRKQEEIALLVTAPHKHTEVVHRDHLVVVGE